MSTKPPTESPLVSVIIPTYNSARFLPQALHSALEQTYRKREIIVVDDGSTDETRTALRRFSGDIRYVYQRHQGVAAARNTGLAAAQGDFVCFLDADDLWPTNKLDLQVAFLQRHHDIGLLSGACRKFIGSAPSRLPFLAQDAANQGARIFPSPRAFTELVRSNFIPTSTVMIRPECFEKVGPFDVRLKTVEDRDMWLRIAAYFTVAHLSYVVCKKRVHDSNVSGDRVQMFETRIKVLEKNRLLFPGLVPSTVWDKQLAKSYLKAGRGLLLRGERKEARRAALRSLRHRFTIKAAGLALATFMKRGNPAFAPGSEKTENRSPEQIPRTTFPPS